MEPAVMTRSVVVIHGTHMNIYVLENKKMR
jgi:hypothetical protein